MPVGDRSLSLVTDPDDHKLLKEFLAIVPRFLRSEIDVMVTKVHELPTIERMFLGACTDLMKASDRNAAVEEATRIITIAFRQLGVNKKNASKDVVSEDNPEREEEDKQAEEAISGHGVRMLEEFLALRVVLKNSDAESL